jgi:hypothetical protein
MNNFAFGSSIADYNNHIKTNKPAEAYMKRDSNISAISLFNRKYDQNPFKGSSAAMDLMRPELQMPSLSQMPRATTMLQDLECYSSRAQGILKDMKYENYLHAKNAAKH